MRSFVLITVAVCLLSHIPSQCKGVEPNIVEMTATHKQPLDLFCNQASADSKQVSWFKDGTPVVAKENEFEIFENHTLRIFKIVPGTVGAYTCQYTATTGSVEMAFQIKVRPSVDAFDKTRNVIQGDPLRLDCKAWGIPMPTVTWFRDEVPLLQDNSKKVTLKPYVPGKNDPYPEVENGTIRIVDLDYPDSGNYSCIVTSSLRVDGEEMTVNATVLVQVKDKYAALWPFLGICAEVAILCTIILIYERRRAKRIEEEERQEEAAHLNANNEARPGVGGDEVRQRK